MSKKHSEIEALRVLANLKVNKPNINLKRIARSLGATIKYVPLDDKLSGSIFIDGNSAKIAVNSFHHPNRQRFTIAHEIGHLVLHSQEFQNTIHVDKKFQMYRNENASRGTDRLEIQANSFASELLMPAFLLEKVVGNMQIDMDEDGTIEELANKFQVSTTAFRFRLGRFYNA